MESSQAREKRLVLEALPLIRKIAQKKYKELCWGNYKLIASLEELIQEGTVGACLAARSYDESKGEFGAFARRRIEGCMLDVFRRRNHEWFEMMHSKNVTGMATAKTFGSQTDPSKINHHRSLQGFASKPAITLLHSETCEIEQNAERALLNRRMAAAIAQLSENQKTVIRDFYFGESSQRAIGNRINLSDSRICELRKEALAKLKSILCTPKPN
jgi:RNA polymerase sigma factor for flagellar operon FliA